MLSSSKRLAAYSLGLFGLIALLPAFIGSFELVTQLEVLDLAWAESGHSSEAQGSAVKSTRGRKNRIIRTHSAGGSSAKVSTPRTKVVDAHGAHELHAESAQHQAQPVAVNPNEEVARTTTSDAQKQFDEELTSDGAIDAILLLDSSGSMKRTDPQRLRDQGAKLFLQFLDERDRVALFQFDAEVKEVAPFQAVTERSRPALERAVSEISDDGGYTDIHAAVQAAWEMFRTQGRAKAKKCVVLLSDGKMDPHPSKGSGEQLNNRLFKVELPGLERLGVRLYSLSLSGEADRELLERIAHGSGGLHWYAPNVDTIHLNFSDLFLSLKKPQVVPLGEGGFEIDSGVHEATFYVSRGESEQRMVITDPLGRRISSKNLPPEVKWYKAKLYDVVTIKNPMPGAWSVQGLDNPEGFATLLTDLKLQVNWPHTLLTAGDKMQVIVRLAHKGSQVSEPGMKDITFYTLKIINADTGRVVESLPFNDRGKFGDEKADDGLYTRILEFNEKGNYKALVAVTSPTFTRQQVISFAVSSELVQLEKAESSRGGNFIAEIAPRGQELSNKRVQLVAKDDHSGEMTAYDFRSLGNGRYQLPFSALSNPGDYHVYARVTGEDNSNESRSYKSEIYTHTVDAPKAVHTPEPKMTADREESAHDQQEDAGHGGDEDEQGQTSKEDKKVVKTEEAGSSEFYAGLTCTILAFISVSGLGLFGILRIRPGDLPDVKGDGNYELPDHIKYMVEDLKSRASKNLREASAEEQALREMLKGTTSLPSQTVISTKAPKEEAEPVAEEVGEAVAPEDAGEVPVDDTQAGEDAVEEVSAEAESADAEEGGIEESTEEASGEDVAPAVEEPKEAEPLSDDDAAALAAAMLDGQDTDGK